MIEQELNAALTEMEKRHQAELMSFDQRRSALAAQLGQAHAAHLAARQQVLTWDNRVASAARPTFGRFVSAAIPAGNRAARLSGARQGMTGTSRRAWFSGPQCRS